MIVVKVALRDTRYQNQVYMLLAPTDGAVASRVRTSGSHESMATRCSQDPEPITMALEDGRNIIHYSFRLQAAGENRTLVECQVGCSSAPSACLHWTLSALPG